MLARNDEHVTDEERSRIEKCDARFLLKDAVRRTSPGDDFAENTRSHAGLISFASRAIACHRGNAMSRRGRQERPQPQRLIRAAS
jgi:hypothetical protein